MFNSKGTYVRLHDKKEIYYLEHEYINKIGISSSVIRGFIKKSKE